ncbi:HEAT repeat domain-containing protein [Zavarzinella formosa]|uniref:HEAT repeat domain-containing protein n=1 Tax=Zavarzinella formosa TaxID=360055 RepID=UPI0002D7E392|nr:HEAT repeat domain-containing protein [Zavarzinella formosa]
MNVRWLLLPIMIALLPTGVHADDRDDNLVRELTAVLKDRLAPTWQRVEAVRTLAKMGASAGLAVPDFTLQLQKLKGEDTYPLQEALVVALGQIGSPSKTAIPTLTRLAGRDVFFDTLLRRSVDQIMAASEDADLPMLIRLLKNRDEAQRLRAAKALGRLGPDAKSAVAELVISLNDPDDDVRRAVLKALGLIVGSTRPSDAISVLILDLQDSDVGFRFRAAKALAAYGREAAPALDALQRAVNDRDKDVRRAITDAINIISGAGN